MFYSFIGETELPSPTIQEEFRRLKMIKGSGKIRQLEVNVSSKNQAVINFSTANNIIEEFKFDLTDAKNSEPIKTRTFDIQGHRSDARCLTFSSCNTAIASVSHETLKVRVLPIGLLLIYFPKSIYQHSWVVKIIDTHNLFL